MNSIEKLWDLLGNDLALLFGKECACATMWMLVCMVFRLVLLILRIEGFVPHGIIFSFPFFIQTLLAFVPIFRSYFPVVPVRLTEGVLGRFSMSKLLVIIPANCLGYILGAAIIQSIRPPFVSMALQPVYYSHNNIILTLVVESALVCLYAVSVIALPILLKVNKLPSEVLSLTVLPLLLISIGGATLTFNPAVNFSLWYVSGGAANAGYLQFDHLVAPLLGGLAAGQICARYFPDDVAAWQQS